MLLIGNWRHCTVVLGNLRISELNSERDYCIYSVSPHTHPITHSHPHTSLIIVYPPQRSFVPNLWLSFAAAIHEGRVQVEGKTLIIRNSDGSLGVFPLLGCKKIYICHYYDKFINCVLRCFDDPPSDTITWKRNTIITGNQGIGKSTFGIYLVWFALTKNRTVVYHTEDRFFMLKPNGSVHYCSSFEADNLLHDPAIIYIADSTKPRYQYSCCITILITSPDEQRYHGFYNKAHMEPIFRVFPLWTLAETESLFASCYPHIPKEAVIRHYHIWGGVPRTIRHNYKFTEEEIDKYITNKLACHEVPPDVFELLITTDISLYGYKRFQFPEEVYNIISKGSEPLLKVDDSSEQPQPQPQPKLEPDDPAFYKMHSCLPSSARVYQALVHAWEEKAKYTAMAGSRSRFGW